MNDKKNSNDERATFGAGCFWRVEEIFRQIAGVTETVVGYMGGAMKNPTYEDVCTDRTGHVEVVQVMYDPVRVTYEKLLVAFWENHDPTQVNRQGPDVGKHYRSVIFYGTPQQKLAAEKSKAEREKSGRYQKPIATAIEPAGIFYAAEEYHQKFLAKRGLGSCPI